MKTDLAIRRTGTKILYRGRVARLTLDSFRTETGRVFRRETFRHPPSVVIVPMMGKDRVLLIRQFRHALGTYIYEIPAGTSEVGETLLSCAKRELAEETSTRAGRWERLLEFYPAPGVSTERMVLYRASGLSVLAHKVAMDKDEYISPWIVPARTAVEMIRKNKIVDAKSILGILMGLERIRW
ncbi:MAG: NUDIX hydrolase [Candidatus Omnitrophica bacterium]|nr:NUDIX hydrolase [Candidatus Omnitrophota bacterium]